MLTTKTVRAALCGAAVLLVTACGGGHGHSPRQLGEMIADTVRVSAGSGGSGPEVPDTSFDTSTYLCVPAVDTRGPGTWRTEAPRSAVEDGDPAELGLLAPDTAETSSVTVSVIGPDGEAASTEADAAPDKWARVRHPDDFGSSPAEGVHTVVWSDTESGTPLACDGFEIT